jgi:hypothetical protein
MLSLRRKNDSSRLKDAQYTATILHKLSTFIKSAKITNKITKEATANLRLAVFLIELLRKDSSDLSLAILSGCYVVGGPIRDIIRWINSIWYNKPGISGKAPDDIDMSIDPSKFASFGETYMETICDHIVKLLDGQVLLGESISVNWSGPDSGTYKINISWGLLLVFDMSQFKSETMIADAICRDTTSNALYCALDVMFTNISSNTDECQLWFMFLISVENAVLTKKIFDPTCNGLPALKDDLIMLCGVHAALAKLGIEYGLGDLSGLNTNRIREILLSSGVKISEITKVIYEALEIIFDDQNYIRIFRLLRDFQKGAKMPYWLIIIIEDWITNFCNTKWSNKDISRKISLLIAKLPKLIPNPQGLPEWSIRLIRFFLDQNPKKTRKELFNSLLYNEQSSRMSIRLWLQIIPDFSDMLLDQIFFILEATKKGYSVEQSQIFWKTPTTIGSFETDPKYEYYRRELLEDDTIKGDKDNSKRINSYIRNKLIVGQNKETVLRLYLEAGPSRLVLITGTIDAPEFSIQE